LILSLLSLIKSKQSPADICVFFFSAESSFNRIAWRHDKVLQAAREKALEHSKLIKTKGYQLMADLDKNRHDFLQTLRSFDSKLKPDIVLINESTKGIIIGELTSAHDILA
jgi:hypothetical protein